MISHLGTAPPVNDLHSHSIPYLETDSEPETEEEMEGGEEGRPILIGWYILRQLKVPPHTAVPQSRATTIAHPVVPKHHRLKDKHVGNCAWVHTAHKVSKSPTLAEFNASAVPLDTHV